MPSVSLSKFSLVDVPSQARAMSPGASMLNRNRRDQDQGQSTDNTIDKERCFGSALAITAKIANAIAIRHAAQYGRHNIYWHLDTNSGCGYNNEADVDGSPVVFHKIADRYLPDMRREAFFCDLKQEYLRDLSHRLELGGWAPTSRLLPGDNEKAVEVFRE